ncbi:MAG: LLM class F420-dependent oxidoreductase [Actinomycetia bacterium]|nr:LLM class F420-dependent oxidoreductase [Actinomycetes bacterium]MCP3911693.1 LLM class F420-dependent oxidoreductase [Actinomycetes bacterium]MCP4086962.1 LLM class F420-dependent oxidoreductase [Actinomycetes bacterium]
MIDIGTVGIWSGALDGHPAGRVREAVAELDAQGWPCLWIPETVSRDPFVAAGMILGATPNLKVATGIASIWARDPMTTANASLTLNEAYDGRFLLGLGVSHHTITEWVRKHDYSKPLTKMREYLDRMDKSMYKGPPPPEPPSRVLAALGPKMLALSAEMADGAHPYFVPVEHTTIARELVGPDKMVATEQMVVLETDPTKAREIARKNMAVYLGLPNYANNLIRMGYTEDEVTNASDRVVDAIVVWGDIDTIASRVKAHQDAGASHVCVQVLQSGTDIPTSAWGELASALI